MMKKSMMKSMIRAAAAAAVVIAAIAGNGGAASATTTTTTTTCEHGAFYRTTTLGGDSTVFHSSLLQRTVQIHDDWAGDTEGWLEAGAPSTGRVDLPGAEYPLRSVEYPLTDTDYPTTIAVLPAFSPDLARHSQLRVGHVECATKWTGGDFWENPNPPDIVLTVAVYDSEIGGRVPGATWDVVGDVEVVVVPSWDSTTRQEPQPAKQGSDRGSQQMVTGEFEYSPSVILPPGWVLSGGPVCSSLLPWTPAENEHGGYDIWCEATARMVASPSAFMQPIVPAAT